MNVKKEVFGIQTSLDQAQLRTSKKADEEHWENEKRRLAQRKMVAHKYGEELVAQIGERRGSKGAPDLQINKDYISNIKQYKGVLEAEIYKKEAYVIPMTSGKKQISQQTNAHLLFGQGTTGHITTPLKQHSE